MDFTWVTTDDANAIQNAIVDAKGDIVAASANDTPARLAVGTDNQRLVAASGETTGLKYVSDTQNTVIDAEGDLLVGDAADTLQRLAIGTTGQVLTVDTSVDGKIKWAAASGGGKVLQVVQGNTTTATTVSSTSFTDTNLSASITPSATGSKILVIFSQSMAIDRASTPIGGSLKLFRGATEVYSLDGSGGGYSTFYANPTTLSAPVANTHYTIITGTYLDSPSTTSSTTYKTQGRASTTANSGNVQFQANSTTSTITLLEIGA